MSWTQEVFNSIVNDPAYDLGYLPTATQSSISTIQTILNSDPNAYNKYVNALVVRIGETYMEVPKFVNPLASLEKADNPMGHLIQEIHFDPIFAEGDFNPQGPNPLGRRNADNVNVAYHQVNYQPQFAISVDRVGMMNAMRSWDDLDRFWGAKIDSMYLGAEISEYVAERQAMNLAIAETTPGKVMPSAYLGQVKAKDTASGQAIVQALKYIIADLRFMHRNTISGCVEVNRPDELILLVNKYVQPNLDVYTLASLFNSSKLDINLRIIPIDTFSADGTEESGSNADVLGLLTVPRFFQFYPTLNTVRPIENPQGLFTNFFFHPWKSVQVSPFATAVVLRSGNAPTA